MKGSTVLWAAAASMALAACGGAGGGAQVPAQFNGTWAADCAQPFVKFDGGRIHVFPDGADYALKSASLGPQGLEVAYDTPQGP